MSTTPAVVPAGTPATPPPERTAREEQLAAIEQLATEFKKEGITSEKSGGEGSETPAPAAAPAKTEEKTKEEPFSAQFQKLAAEKAKLQEQAARVKLIEEAYSVVPPAVLGRLVSAVKSGNVKAQLEVLGLTPEEIRSALGGQPAAPAKAEDDEKPARAVDPDIEELKQELRALKAARQAEETQKARGQVMDIIKDKVGKMASDVPTLAALEEHEAVLEFIEDFQRKNGRLPGDDAEESIAIAAKMVEERLTAQKARWSKVLTSAGGAGTVTSKAPDAASSPKGAGTLHNGMTAAAGGQPEPESIEDRLKLVAADPTFLAHFK